PFCFGMSERYVYIIYHTAMYWNHKLLMLFRTPGCFFVLLEVESFMYYIDIMVFSEVYFGSRHLFSELFSGVRRGFGGIVGIIFRKKFGG
ncbi:MAG TPA: hypothetical protein VEB40_04350, partial [Flavipsychrobacter sp.]|nr:hypothetical protein [Flavipsychrobacter sp.]